jgi:hypothetical protein
MAITISSKGNPSFIMSSCPKVIGSKDPGNMLFSFNFEFQF